MTKIIKIANRDDLAYRIRKTGFYYKAAWIKWDEKRGAWEYWGHVGSSLNGYKTEANAMRGIKRHAESLGYEIL